MAVDTTHDIVFKLMDRRSRRLLRRGLLLLRPKDNCLRENFVPSKLDIEIGDHLTLQLKAILSGVLLLSEGNATSNKFHLRSRTLFALL